MTMKKGSKKKATRSGSNGRGEETLDALSLFVLSLEGKLSELERAALVRRLREQQTTRNTKARG